MMLDNDELDFDDGQDHITGKCTQCGEICTSMTFDNGIGPYDHFGHCGTHHEWVEVSPCCQAEINEDYLDEEDE